MRGGGKLQKLEAILNLAKIIIWALCWAFVIWHIANGK